MAATATAPRMLRVRDVAARLGLHEDTIRRRVADGTLPSTKLGGVVLIAAEAVERIESGR